MLPPLDVAVEPAFAQIAGGKQVPDAVGGGVGRPPSRPGLAVLVPAAAFGPLPTGVRVEVDRAELVQAEDDFGLAVFRYDLAVGDGVELLDDARQGRRSAGRGTGGAAAVRVRSRCGDGCGVGGGGERLSGGRSGGRWCARITRFAGGGRRCGGRRGTWVFRGTVRVRQGLIRPLASRVGSYGGRVRRVWGGRGPGCGGGGRLRGCPGRRVVRGRVARGAGRCRGWWRGGGGGGF